MALQALTSTLLSRRVDLLSPSMPSTVAAYILPVSEPIYDHVVASLSDLPAAIGGYRDLTSGSWLFTAPVDIGNTTLRINNQTVHIAANDWTSIISGSSVNSVLYCTGGGVLLLENCAIAGTANIAVYMDSTSQNQLVNCVLSTTAGNTVHCAGTTRAELIGCKISQAASDHCLQLNGAASVSVIGGRMLGPGATGWGVYINGNITQGLQVVGVNFDSLLTGISRSSGTVRGVTISGCRMTTSTGISYAAGIPTMGLLIVGNLLDCATPISGFTAATARVNMKGNAGQAALLQETAIVP